MIFQDVSKFFPPSAGYLRDFLLLADSLIVFMSFEICAFFLYRSISASRKMREGKMEEERKADNVWGIFFFGFGIMRLIFIIGDFYANQLDSGLVRLDYVAIGYLSMALVACVFIYSMESRISSRSRARPITVIFLIFFAALIVAYIFKFHFDQAVAVFLGFPFLLLLLLYTARIRLKFQLGKRSFISYIFGLFGIIFGLIATSDTLIWLSNGWWWRGVGDFILVASLTALWDFFTNLPSWSEFSWKAKTQAVYLFYINSGLGVFEHHYYSSSTATPDGGQGSVVDQDLLVPGLTSIKELLERISKQPSTEPVRTYKQEDAVILLEYGQWVAAAAICKEDLKSVRRLLKKFVHRVEELFAEILPEWDGNLNDLAAVREIFQTLSSPAAFSITKTPAMGKKLVVGLYSSVKRAIKGKNKKDRASSVSRAK
ncbi:MAG TPA: hypothetical protein VKK79_26260, partial [Candidatus Lokiarchaeia archaeon]|nr:hypothetical protein [Candidatus Lokiarchaeia archaeon]